MIGLLVLGTVQFWITLFIYRPSTLANPAPSAWGLPAVIPITSRYPDGTAMTGWWSRPSTSGMPVLLIVHGRSGNMASRATVMRRLIADGFGVLMFDYRGYGASVGRPSERALIEDTRSAYLWLRANGIPARRIVVVGQSLGNAPAAALAAQEPIGALILVSPFTNLPDALNARLPWLPIQLLPWSRNRFDVRDSLRHFKGPTVLFASNSDGLIPIYDAKRLGISLPQSRWVDVTPLHHDGMLGAIASDGRLTKAVRSLTLRS